jgi:NADH-quinone oxidoreductase subunit L
MSALLWLIPALPLLGFAVLALFGGTVSRRALAAIAMGAVGGSAAVTFILVLGFLASPPSGGALTQTLAQWFTAGGLSIAFGLRLDALSLVMIGVITGVGFLIHCYSATFMAAEHGYRRYFAALNLFVFGMLMLVLADNLLLLFLGWEMVGLCSYLLIGHSYEDPDNGRAARKAFVVTRIGDAAMAVGLFLLFTELGTLHLATLLERAANNWSTGEPLAIAASALLLAGAVGKSAQLPLQVWLPDAMAGPSPVSALIHAATMVTAGVYLIARMHGLFELAPPIQALVATIGAATLLLAAASALTQRDIKRVLAYSTISQIGYMVMALGVGAYSAAMFHFMTHAFFKALLFLAAGVIIMALHDEHDIFRMGGLRHRLPGTALAFLIGAASLAAFPLVTAGFYSKDLILWETYAASSGSVWLWLAGLLGAFLTGVYTFRMIFVAFLGSASAPIVRQPRKTESTVLAVLAVLALIGGFVQLPPLLGDLHLFSAFMHATLPEAGEREGLVMAEWFALMLSSLAGLLGIAVAWHLYGRGREDQRMGSPGLRRLLENGGGFDTAYGRAVVQPFVAAARINRHDFVDRLYTGVAGSARWLHERLSAAQTGRLRWYAAGMTGGAIVLATIAVLS